MNSIPDGTMRGLAPRQLAAELAVPSTLLQRRAARARELMQADWARRPHRARARATSRCTGTSSS